jgi:hypothetical protein
MYSPNFGIGTTAQSSSQLRGHLNAVFRQRCAQVLGVCVANEELHALKTARDHVVNCQASSPQRQSPQRPLLQSTLQLHAPAFPPAPPTPTTTIFGAKPDKSVTGWSCVSHSGCVELTAGGTSFFSLTGGIALTSVGDAASFSTPALSPSSSSSRAFLKP